MFNLWVFLLFLKFLLFLFVFFFLSIPDLNELFFYKYYKFNPAVPVRRLEYPKALDFIICFDRYSILFVHLFLKLLRWDFELLLQVHQILCKFNPFSPMFLLRKQQYSMKKMKKNFILSSTISSAISTTFPNFFHF